MSLAEQIKTWYELESYDAFKQVIPFKNDTFHDGERYIVPMLWNKKKVLYRINVFPP